MTINIGLLGAGRIGQVHANAIYRDRRAQLICVADALPEAAASLAQTYGAKAAQIDEILQDATVDAVLICTPTDTHADLIERAARAGKAIFCEKPVDLATDRVRACLKVVDQTGAVLMLGFNRRFDPHFAALKAAVQRGDIGKVEQVLITSRDPALPPAEYITRSGGIFRDMTIHDFDMARFLLDEPIMRVQAVASVLCDPAIQALGDYDTASVVMESESGAQVVISNSRRALYGYDQRIEVAGSLGMVQAENQRAADIQVAGAAGFTRPVLHDFFMTRYEAAYAAEIGAFIAAVEQGGAMPVTGQDGLAALLLAEAALESVRTGAAVELSLV